MTGSASRLGGNLVPALVRCHLAGLSSMLQ